MCKIKQSNNLYIKKGVNIEMKLNTFIYLYDFFLLKGVVSAPYEIENNIFGRKTIIEVQMLIELGQWSNCLYFW